MRREKENQGFSCLHCGGTVLPLTNGSYRNHCPHCLYSLHVDIAPGDRANPCKSLMRPVGITYHSKKGYQLVHQCLACGQQKRNKIVQEGAQPDNFSQIIQLMQMAVY